MRYLDDFLDMTIGELRQEIALEDADLMLRDWLECWDNRPKLDNTDEDECWDEDDEYCDEDNECWDEDNEEEPWHGEDYECITGSEELPNKQEEDLAVRIANDIDDGKYSLSCITNLYPQNIIDRITYLID